MKKHGLRLGILGVLTLVFLYFFFRKVPWDDFVRSLTSVNVFLFALVILLAPLHFITRAVRWHVLLRHEKKGVRFANTFAANAVGFTVTNIFPGRLGEIVKPLYLARKEGMRNGFVLGTVVVERIFDMFTMCALLGIFLLAKPLYASVFDLSPESAGRLIFWGKIAAAFATAVLLVSLSLYFFKARTLAVIGFILKPFPERFRDRALALVREFIEGLTFFRSVGDMLLYTLLSFGVWLAIVFYYWILLQAYHVRVPYFALIPYVFLTMVGASIPTPGMVGGFDFFSKLGMTSILHVDPTLATGMTVVMHVVQIVVTCLIGYVILWKEGLSLFQLKKMGETERL